MSVRNVVMGGVLLASLLFSLPTVAATTLLYFNDAHEIEPVDEGVRGGMARLAGVIAAERARTEQVLVLFGGDLAGGTLFGLMKGEPIVDAFNLIGVDVATFGQHDFDHGVTHTRELIARSAFPWITSNLTELDGQPFNQLPQYKVIEVGGLRLGFIGLTTAMDTTLGQDEVIEQPVVPAARAAVRALQAANVEVVVAITQQSIEEDRALVAAVPEIDLVLGEEMSETVSQLERIGSHYLARSAGNISSVVRVELPSADIADWRLSVVPIDANSPESPEVARLAAVSSAALDSKLSEIVRDIATAQHWSRQTARSERVALGTQVAESFRQALQADIGLISGGGLRADLSVQAPALTLRELAAVLPFNNRLVRIRLTVGQLRKALEQGLAEYPLAHNQFPQWSGLEVMVDWDAPPGTRVQAISQEGQALSDTDTITLAVTQFMAGGGDGYVALREGQIEATGPLDREAFAAWWASREMDGD